jgi:hypothetical protein
LHPARRSVPAPRCPLHTHAPPLPSRRPAGQAAAALRSAGSLRRGAGKEEQGRGCGAGISGGCAAGAGHRGLCGSGAVADGAGAGRWAFFFKSSAIQGNCIKGGQGPMALALALAGAIGYAICASFRKLTEVAARGGTNSAGRAGGGVHDVSSAAQRAGGGGF